MNENEYFDGNIVCIGYYYSVRVGKIHKWIVTQEMYRNYAHSHTILTLITQNIPFVLIYLIFLFYFITFHEDNNTLNFIYEWLLSF